VDATIRIRPPGSPGLVSASSSGTIAANVALGDPFDLARVRSARRWPRPN
jgi:hypothetical protein